MYNEDMRKTISLLLILLIVSGCAAKPKHFYNLKIGEDIIVVGYDNPDILYGKDYINSYTTYLDKKENEHLESIEIYVDDLPTSLIMLNEDVLSDSIENTCINLKGEFISKNGNACVLHKTVKKKDNYVILTGDILDDNPDKLDRIQIYYK